MANIKIDNLARKVKIDRNFTYSDIKLDLAFDYTTNN